MLFIGLAYWILISIPRERMKGCYFGYEQMPIMSNEKYTGKIDAKMEHILIEDHVGTKVTELDLLGNSPDQVVLGGEDLFFYYIDGMTKKELEKLFNMITSQIN